MDDAFIGEIRLLPYPYVPPDWLECDGKTLPVGGEYQALGAIIGNAFGGVPTKTFALPDLRGRAAVGSGDNPADQFKPALGVAGGAETVALTPDSLPSHSHSLTTGTVANELNEIATAAGNWIGPAVFQHGGTTLSKTFVSPSANTAPVQLNAGTLSVYPGGQGAHENRQPFVAMRYCICYDGEFPVAQS